MPFDERRFSASARGMRFSAIRRMSALAERPGLVSFAPGHPSPDTFPGVALAEIAAEVMAGDGAGALQYVPTRGLAGLLEALGEYAAAKGIRAESDEILVTEGSQQALDLITRVLVDPGDAVLVELPSYIGATACFRAARARILGVRLDAGGIDLEDLRRRHAEATRSGAAVKFLYVVPSYQNPSGLCHSLARRRALLELARELGLLIVEDDPYGDLYFDAPPPAPLRSLDEQGEVVYVSSFSKVLAPGLRTAFVVGPAPLLEKLEIAKQSADLCGSGLDQRIVLQYLRRGLMAEQAARIRPYYRAKRDALAAALARHLPRASWTTPGGGLFLWLALPVDTESLLEAAVAGGVAYVPGRPFFVDDSGAETARLTFAREPIPMLEEGARRLAQVLGARLAGQSR